MIRDGNTNSMERELDNIINCPEKHQNFEYLPNRGISSHETEIRIIDNRNGPVRKDGLPESIELLSSEMNASFCRIFDFSVTA